jgi:hypothetical protein
MNTAREAAYRVDPPLWMHEILGIINGRFCRPNHDDEAACGSNLSATPFMQ